VSEKAKLLSKSGEVDEDPYGEKLAKVRSSLVPLSWAASACFVWAYVRRATMMNKPL